MPDTGWDIASGILGYRDRTSFTDRQQNAGHFEDSAVSPFNSLNWNGRSLTTLIPAIRETPGFGGRGEVLAVTDHTAGNSRVPVVDQIDSLGRDTANSGVLGTNTSSYKTGAMARDIDGIPDNYAEKLLVASGLMSTVTTRSDVFAVWFVLQGYQKSDTENLHPFDQNEQNAGIVDPLIPSVSKRFLMIVDRSNVTRLGEKPKVLLLTELPMNP
jgi:hypothetical protein